VADDEREGGGGPGVDRPGLAAGAADRLDDVDVRAVGDVHGDRRDEVLHLRRGGGGRAALGVGTGEGDAGVGGGDAGGGQVDARLAEPVLAHQLAQDRVEDGVSLPEVSVVDGAVGKAGRGQVDTRIPGGAEPAVQGEGDDGVVAAGEVEGDEHVA